jgi:hypothetical protein
VCPRPSVSTAAREIPDRRTCPMTGVIGSEYVPEHSQRQRIQAAPRESAPRMKEDTLQCAHGQRSQTSAAPSDTHRTTRDDPREPQSNDPLHRPSMLRIRLPHTISELSPPGKFVSIDRDQNGAARRQVQ